MLKKIKYVKDETIWFCVESYSFIKPWKINDIIYFPKAYYKFMKLSLGGYNNVK